jgi:hypothetical protein
MKPEHPSVPIPVAPTHCRAVLALAFLVAFPCVGLAQDPPRVRRVEVPIPIESNENASDEPATEARAAPRDEPTVRVHDCGDLVRDEGDTEAASASLDALANFVRRWAQPQITRDGDVKTLRGRYLVVLAGRESHAWTEALLTSLRGRGGARGEMLLIEGRWLEIAPDAYEQYVAPLVGGEFVQDENGVATAAPSALLDGDAGAERLCASLIAEGRADVLQSPRVLVWPMQRATVTTGEETSYIKDFEIEKVDDTTIANPVVDTLFDGMQLDVQVGRLPDGTFGVHVRSEISELESLTRHSVDLAANPDVVRRFPGLPSTKVWIQLPVVTRSQFESDVRMPDDSTFVVVLPGTKDARRRVMLLHVEAVAPDLEPDVLEPRRGR